MPELEQLAISARQAESRGDFTEELRLWRQAMDLAPRGSEEFDIINARVQLLSARVDAGRAPDRAASKLGQEVRTARACAVTAVEVQDVPAIDCPKAKLLLFGLGKFSTFGSMLLSVLPIRRRTAGGSRSGSLHLFTCMKWAMCGRFAGLAFAASPRCLFRFSARLSE